MYPIIVKAHDDDGGCASASLTVLVLNVAPTVVADPDLRGDEGSLLRLCAEYSDPGFDSPSGDTFEDFDGTIDWGDGTTDTIGIDAGPCMSSLTEIPGSPGNPTTGSLSGAHTYVDNGVYTVTMTVCDDDGGCGSDTTTVTITNVAPVVSITGPPSGSVFPVGTPVTFTGVFMDPGIADLHAWQWEFVSWDTVIGVNGGPCDIVKSDGTGTITTTFTFANPGVYSVKLSVEDDDCGSGSSTTVNGLPALVVIYDPSAGFVTGGGWINSPAGAYTAEPSLTGKAVFGFVSRYKAGAAKPTGDTQFRFIAAGLAFQSTEYDWLVISGARAQYKGSGAINGAGNYGFLLTVVDGDLPGGGGVDKFRIKIWDLSSGVVVYDNRLGASDDSEPTTILGGGRIAIQKG
ncbi:MAG: PKD domain-containing protein [Methanobacteriota archaeon]